MVEVKPELVALSNQVWERLRARFEGLTDEEYRWEPVSGCWSVGPRPDGTWRAEGTFPRPDPEPFTTIAWRLWHLIDMYGENRAPRWLDVAAQGDPIGLDDPNGAPPACASDALALLERAHDRWEAHLSLVSEEQLGMNVGPVGGDYAERPRSAYVLHMLDEFIHHSAEIAVLRDLWRWQRPLGTDAATERAMRGDITIAAELDVGLDRSATDLVDIAAAYARWELVIALVRSGVPQATEGRTPLHLAAVAGELDVVRELVQHGADPTVKDPHFHATPLLWAQFLGQDDVVAWLETNSGASAD